MKKIMSIGLVFLLILSVFLNMSVSAQALNDVSVSIGGEISKIQYSQTSNSELIYIQTSSPTIAKHYVLPPEGSIKYYRLIFEISDTSVPHTVRFDVDKGSVGQIRLANLSEPKRTNVVVELNKNPDYTLAPSSDGKAVVLTIKGFKGAVNPPSSNPSTPTPTPTPSTTPTPKPSPSVSPTPSNSASSGNQGSGSSVIKQNGPLSWEMSGDTCIVTLKGITLSNTTNSALPRFELREIEKILQITIPGKDNRFSNGFLSGNKIIRGILVNYSEKTNSTIIRISYFDHITYTSSVSNGNTVFNIKAGKAGSQTPAPKPSTSPSPTTTPKPSQTPAPSTNPTEPSRGTSSSIKNIEVGDGSNVVLRLVNQGIVNRYRNSSSEIITDDSTKNGTITFMIPKSIVDLGTGNLTLNNGLVKTVVAYTTLQNSFLMLDRTNPSQKFSIVEGTSPNELLVVSEKPTNTKSKLVVLDPGHGGSDPGGTVGSYYEKDYNLDIALKCMAILKSQGINVDITRTTDVFISLDYRAEFANERKADLFVSIHNNIMPDGFKGSMALYYPTSYKGKEYASIIQNNLVKDLGPSNIGLKANGDLVVLRKTKMPAVLAEIACMNNADEMAKLNTSSFRQKAAESLANSIIKIINSM